MGDLAYHVMYSGVRYRLIEIENVVSNS